MFLIKYVTSEDKKFWLTMDNHGSEPEFDRKVRDARGYVIFVDEKPAGIMYYSLLWDKLPFLNLICLDRACRGNGYGRLAMEFWEKEMAAAGFKMVLLSTQADETAQHFYRKLNYRDCGCLVLNDGPLAQPMEMFFCKQLKS